MAENSALSARVSLVSPHRLETAVTSLIQTLSNAAWPNAPQIKPAQNLEETPL